MKHPSATRLVHAIVLASTLGAVTAQASIYEYVVTGTVKQRTVYDSDPNLTSALLAQFPNDTPYTFRFTLDFSKQTTIENTAGFRTYDNTNAFLGGSLTFGPLSSPIYSATLGSLGSITIANDRNIGTIGSPILVDAFNLSGATVSGPSLSAGGSSFDVDTPTGIDFAFSTAENSLPKNLFSSTDMPLAINNSLIRSNFAAVRLFFREVGDEATLGFVGGGLGGSNLLITPSTITVTAVPEPANAGVIAGAATLALLVVRRGSRRAS